MIRINKERMSPVFCKYHVKGLPFDLVLHHFTSIAGEDIHDHPFSFQSIILFGGYTERIFSKTGEFTTVFRAPGTTHNVAADCIHEIINLPKGECWTAILPGPKVQDSGFYKFSDGNAWHRFWHENQWRKVEQ